VKKWTNFLATVSVAGALAVFPGVARADGVNQMGGVAALSGGPGPAVAGTLSITSFAFSISGGLFALGSFTSGGPAVAALWNVSITPGVGGFTLTLSGSPATTTTNIVFTTGVSAAQNQLVNAINFEALRSDSSNIREWYLLSILKRLYP
jgi:hypothetical protein